MDSNKAEIGEFYPDLVHNEPVIYRAILFAQKAQVSVGTERRKGISCNPRAERGNAALAHLLLTYTLKVTNLLLFCENSGSIRVPISLIRVQRMKDAPKSNKYLGEIVLGRSI